MELRRLKTTEVKDFKLELLKKQGFKDAITGKPLKPENSVLDHQHRGKKTDEIGVDGAGLIRGVLDNQINCAEGKIFNAMKRYCGITTNAERIEFLEKLVEYYKKGTLPVIHPTEKMPEPKVSKKNYNKLKKEFVLKYPKKKFPEYPRSGKITKVLEKLFQEFNIPAFN